MSELNVELKVVANVGPVAAVVHVNENFMFYKSGIFYDPECNNKPANHGVLVNYDIS